MRFAYLNTANTSPQDRHLIDGLRELGHEVFELCSTSPRFAKYKEIERQYDALKEPCEAVIVGYTSPLLVPLARKLRTKKVIFNAIASQYEANIVSRSEDQKNILKIAKWWLMDFFSFHLSSKVLLESDAQIDYVRSLFFVPKRKLVKSYSGLNEKDFFLEKNIEKRADFTVIFRGRFLSESGILTVIEASKIIENSGVKFTIIGAGYMYREVNALIEKLIPRNLTMISETLPASELRKIMMSSHISLGQVADHPRLDRTLPCKLFESLALKLPYLTGRNKGALEVLTENVTCFCINPGDAQDLARKILELKDDPDALKKIGEAGYDLYREKLTSKKLAQEVINLVI